VVLLLVGGGGGAHAAGVGFRLLALLAHPTFPLMPVVGPPLALARPPIRSTHCVASLHRPYPQVRLHGSPLMDEAAFIEGLSRAAIFMLSRSPLDGLFPADGGRVDAVFRR
jgi:hypothetical protein